jgi:hypothetical protein
MEVRREVGFVMPESRSTRLGPRRLKIDVDADLSEWLSQPSIEISSAYLRGAKPGKVACRGLASYRL